jgi:mannose-6-phosphate isomerase-like protein (cupin superfamily)
MFEGNNEKRIVKSGSAKLTNVLGVQVAIQISGRDTAGDFAQYESLVQPGGGPPPHIHLREDETFYVLEGEFDIVCGEETIQAKPGDYAYAPKGALHTFKNTGTTPGRILTTSCPAGHELFFEEIDQLSQNGPLSMEEIVAVCERHHMIVPPPPAG